MILVLLFQPLKKNIHRVLVLFIIFPDIHRIEHLQKCRKVLFFFRCLVMNVSDQRRVEQRLRLGPELIPGFSFSFRIGDQRCNELQYVLLRVNIGKGIVFHRFPEIDRIEDLDDIRFPDHPALLILQWIAFLIQLRRTVQECIPAFHQNTAFRICDHIRAMHLEKIRFQPEPCLATSRTANDQDVLVPGIAGILRAVAHHE